MRISDWSSDVCSSDLAARPEHEQPGRPPVVRHPSAIGLACDRFLVVLRQPIRETAAPTRGKRQPDRAPGMNESDARSDVDDLELLHRMAHGARAALAPPYLRHPARLCRILAPLNATPAYTL